MAFPVVGSSVRRFFTKRFERRSVSNNSTDFRTLLEFVSDEDLLDSPDFLIAFLVPEENLLDPLGFLIGFLTPNEDSLDPLFLIIS